MADTYSPEWWLRNLYVGLVKRRPYIDRAVRYYDGDHSLAFTSEKFLQAFGGLFRAFADNWCGVVVDAVEERMTPTGIRIGDEPKADQDAWRIWQANDLDIQSQLVHQEALVGGVSYVVIWVDENERPEITAESGISTIVARHPKFRQRRQAALRCYLDDDGFEHAELFLPTEVYLYVSKTKRTGAVDPKRVQWEPDTTVPNVNSSGAMANPLGIVPVVEFMNRPRLSRSERAGFSVHSEIASIIPLQDAVNKLIADMLVASEFAAFPQRHLTGYEPTVDPVTKQVVPPAFQPGPGRLWWLEDPDARFGQFEAANLANFVQAVEMTIGHIASISRTPPHYLSPAADRLSGESIKSAETGLVAKVTRRMSAFSDPWEEVLRIAGKIAGNVALAEATSSELVWADPESRTESQHVDAVLKKKDIGVPLPQLWEDLGYSPQQIDRFPALRAQTELEAAALTGPFASGG